MVGRRGDREVCIREKMRSRKKHPDSCDAPNYHATTIVTIFAEGHDAALTHGPRSSKSE